MKTEPLAIVGIGCLFPKADGPGAYWANCRDGVDGIGDIPASHWNPDDYFDPDPKRPDMTYARRGGFLSPVAFDPLEFGIAPRDLEATDTSQLLGLVAAKRALEDANVRFTDKGGTTDRNRVSVILGVTGTLELVIPLGARLGHPRWKKAMQEAGIPDDAAADACQRIADSYVPWQENSFPGLLGNVVAGRIANRLDLGGTNCVVDAACASSLSAVHLAALELQAGRSDVAVTGGVDTFNDIFMYMCFSKTPALSPTGDARPFDADGDGTILGEGVGVVVLKRLSDAEAAGDRVYAVIKSIGSSSDGKGTAIYAPSAAGQQKAIRTAYELAGVTPDTIELVEAHGTGTKVGDAVEASALRAVYGDGPPRVAVGSVKSMIGHTKAAAGAASLIKAALALHYKTLPPTLKVSAPVGPLAGDGPFYVNTEKRPWLPRPDHPRRAALSAFGFGGSNFHAVLEEHTGTKQETDWDGSVEILALSGTADAVRTALDAVPGDWNGFARAAEASRGTFAHDAPTRLVLVAHRTRTDLAKLLAGARGELAAKPASGWHTPDGASYGVGPAAGTVGVLFPGQGSQQVGMLRDLACVFPELLDTLAEANDPLPDGRRLSDLVYPPRSFAADAAETQAAALTATDVAQPALGAVSFGAWRLLSNRFGLDAAAFAGHSYGELPALAAAGRITSEDLFALSRRRGELMKAAAGDNAGAMLAVVAAQADVEQTVAELGLKVVVANQNSPTQTVLSGATADIDAAAVAFKAQKVKAVRLPVAAAFHSPLVAQASWPFRDSLRGVRVSGEGRPVYANTTAQPYPDDAGLCRDLLGGQLARPVRFADTVRAMAETGVRTFVEVGPGGVLSKLAEATLADAGVPDFLTVAVGPAGAKRPGMLDLASLLARLSARGHAVNLSAWEAGSSCRPAPEPAGHTVPVGGANVMTPRPARPSRPPTRAVVGTEPVRQPELPPAETAMSPPPTSDALGQALSLTQQTLAALQQLQEQTARLHKQFLESQEQAQRTLFALVGQQQALIGGTGLVAPTPLPPVASLPPPVIAPVLTPAAPVAPPVMVVKPAVPAAKPAPAPVAKPNPADVVERVLLEVVAEKTGYPAGLLDPAMQLDADLGIDSIKRVEILAALQDRLPDAPQVRPEHLGALHTLRDIAAFLATPADGPAALPADAPMTVAMSQLKLSLQPESALLGLGGPGPDAVSGLDAVERVLLEVVAEKTGYPAGLLDPAMQLDADLGIDSIKRVEILAALQDRLPDAPQVRPEHLGALHTLRDIAAFLATPADGPTTTKMRVVLPRPRADDGPPSSVMRLGAPALTPTPGGDGPPTQAVAVRPTATPPSSVVDSSQALPGTLHQPVAVLAPDGIDRSLLQAVDLDLTAPRPRLALPAGGEVWVVGPDDALTAGVCDQLAGQRLAPRRFAWADPDAASPAGRPVGLVLVAPARTAPTLHLNKLAYRWLQAAGPLLRSAGRPTAPTLLATVARLDGAFGLADLAADADPLPGGLAGLAKTARHEWPEVSVKAIDVAPGFVTGDPLAAAAAVAEELLTVGPLEVGIAATHRSALELARSVRRPAPGGPALTPADVVLVTGGGRGVTAEVAVALAQAFRCTLVLTGRTQPAAGPEPDWLAGLSDEASMKQAIASHLGTTASPKAVGDFYARTVAQREVARTLRRCEAAGSKAAYFSVNAGNGRQVADLIHQVTVKHGPVTGLVHGAGVLADRRIEDLTPDQFDTVYATKVDGARTLLDLLAHQELKVVLLFGSTTGRVGRVGQLAYACANEVLNKIAQVQSRRRPGARVVAVNWGPWDGGMVTPGLRKVFEGEGVGLIPLADGGRFAVQELSAAGRPVEVVAIGKPGKSAARPTSPPGVQFTPPPAGGLTNAPTTMPPPPAAELKPVFERVLDVDNHPVLRSHVLDGRAVLPMALHLEFLAHAALHGNPGLVFHGLNDLRIIAAAKVEDAAGTPLRAVAGKAVKQDRLFVVPVELRGKRRDGRDALFSRAEVVLTAALPKPPAAEPLPSLQPYPHPVEEVYQYFLFHGPDLHGIERVDGVGETGFVGTAYPAPPPAEWLAQPLRSSWVADPLVLDASFQMMILWSFVQHGAGSLPCFAGRYRQYRRAFPAGPVRVVIRVTRDNGSFARADIDYLDPDGTVVAQVQDYECVIDRQLDAAFRKNQLAPKAVV